MKKVIRLLFSGEFLFGLFLMAGAFKASVSLIDLTILFLVLSGCVGLYRLLKNPQIPKSAIKPIFLYLAFIAFMLFSLLYTPSEIYAKDKFLRFLILTGWSFVGVFLIIDRNKPKQSVIRFLSSFVVVSVMMGFIAVYKILKSSSDVHFLSVLGSNYLYLGKLTSMGAIILFIVYMYSNKKLIIRFASLFVAMCLVFVALKTGGRMPVISLALCMLLLISFSVKITKSRVLINKSLLLSFSILPIALIGVYLNADTFNTIFKRLNILFEGGGTSALGRIDRFSAAIATWENNPILGMGLGSFPIAYSGQDASDYPHNIFLEILSELGLVGLIIFFPLLFLGIIKILKLLRKKNPYIISLFALFLYTFINSLVSGDFNDNKMFFSFLSFLYISHYFKDEEKEHTAT